MIERFSEEKFAQALAMLMVLIENYSEYYGYDWEESCKKIHLTLFDVLKKEDRDSD